MATAMENNLAVMKAVTDMPYTKLVDMVRRHYPIMFDVCAWEKHCSLQGLGTRNNLVLYLTVANTLGIKDQFVAELTDRGCEEPGIVDADFNNSAADCDLESDPSYTIGFTCNTTRGCVCDIEQDLTGDTVKCYEYIGTDNDQIAAAQNQGDTSGLSDTCNIPTVGAKETESAPETATEPSERIVETLIDKHVLDIDTVDSSNTVVVDDD